MNCALGRDGESLVSHFARLPKPSADPDIRWPQWEHALPVRDRSAVDAPHHGRGVAEELLYLLLVAVLRGARARPGRPAQVVGPGEAVHGPGAGVAVLEAGGREAGGVHAPPEPDEALHLRRELDHPRPAE